MPTPINTNSSIKLSPDKSCLYLSFVYNSRVIELIKEISGRKWDPMKKIWTIPATKDNLDKAIQFIPRIQDRDEAQSLLEDRNTLPQVDLNLPPGLKLRPFQLEGVRFIESRNGRALLADEMGLGKTIQALAWLRFHPDIRPAIVVVPASLKVNWLREVRKWLGYEEKVQVVSGYPNGKNPGLILTGKSIIIINYDILPDELMKDPERPRWKAIKRNGWWGWIKVLKPKAIIIDEVHFIKSPRAQRTKIVRMLCKGVPHIIAMSGTPIVNRPKEAYQIINLVNKNLFPNYWGFMNRYCNPKKNWFGTDYSGASNTEELHKILTDTVMIRRLKADVLKELPPKVRSIIPLGITNRDEYREAAVDFMEWLQKTEGDKAVERAERAKALVKLEKLKHLAAIGKLRSAMDWIESTLIQGEKLVVFCIHKDLVDAIMKKFGKVAVKLTGSDSQKDRQIAVDRFQGDDKIRLFIGNIQAAGIGINLTASSQVAFLEVGWTPGEIRQAEDRTHRIGQDNSVNIYYLVAEQTIEEHILDLLMTKEQVVDSVLDGKNINDESVFGELLKRLKGKDQRKRGQK